MSDWRNLSHVEQRDDRVSAQWVFSGTRVPVAALFENLREAASVEQFCQWFPGVSTEQARAVLDCEASLALASRP